MFMDGKTTQALRLDTMWESFVACLSTFPKLTADGIESSECMSAGAENRSLVETDGSRPIRFRMSFRKRSFSFLMSFPFIVGRMQLRESPECQLLRRFFNRWQPLVKERLIMAINPKPF